jgi:hypothetical protein
MREVAENEQTATLSEQVDASDLPDSIKRRARCSLVADDARVEVVWYCHGWIANSYRYPSAGGKVTYTFTGDGPTRTISTYDRKVSGGWGPEYVVRVAKKGQKKGRLV